LSRHPLPSLSRDGRCHPAVHHRHHHLLAVAPSIPIAVVLSIAVANMQSINVVAIALPL
jgi:hypothetical protein